MNSVFELVDEAITKSRQQLLLAETTDWELFIEQEVDRQALLHSIKLEDIVLEDNDNEMLHRQINELLSINERLESLCINERYAAAAELQKIRQSSKVNKAYGQQDFTY